MSRIRIRSRREFLRDSASLVAAAYSMPNFLARTAVAASGSPLNDRILVLVQLSGGNDGLNTVVPFRDDAYYAARPTIGVPRDQALALDSDVALHPKLAGLKRLFDDGMLSVVQNVGYPNPNRSHFSSMDIWHTADAALSRLDTGWLGRAADVCGCGGQSNAARDQAPWAIHLDHEALPLALRAERASIPSIADISSLKIEAAAGPDGERIVKAIEATAEAGRADASDALLYVQRAAVAACANARRLEQVARDGKAAVTYPDFGLAQRLRQIATLISADLGTRVYYTSLGGFDTHSKQQDVHPRLMSELGDSVAAFFEDLKARGLHERVLLMTFSEFGRRVKENGSRGTDHGAAAPLFIAGPPCKAGVVGRKPNFDDLDEGDLKYDVDFRRVYATVLEQHLGIAAKGVLGKAFSPIEILRAR